LHSSPLGWEDGDGIWEAGRTHEERETAEKVYRKSLPTGREDSDTGDSGVGATRESPDYFIWVTSDRSVTAVPKRETTEGGDPRTGSKAPETEEEAGRSHQEAAANCSTFCNSNVSGSGRYSEDNTDHDVDKEARNRICERRMKKKSGNVYRSSSSSSRIDSGWRRKKRRRRRRGRRRQQVFPKTMAEETRTLPYSQVVSQLAVGLLKAKSKSESKNKREEKTKIKLVKGRCGHHELEETT
jgi:hypothetical protein